MIRENQQLTKNFSLFEMTETGHKDLQEKNRDLFDEQIEKLKYLAQYMELIRIIIGRPVIVRSGYRCPELNARVKGTPLSQHILCEACDFIGEDLPPEQTFNLICYKAPFLQFGQLILETRQGLQWVHLSVKGRRPPEKCGQVFKMDIK